MVHCFLPRLRATRFFGGVNTMQFVFYCPGEIDASVKPGPGFAKIYHLGYLDLGTRMAAILKVS